MASIKTLNVVSGESIKSIQTVPGENIKNVLGITVAAGDNFANQVNNTSDLAAWWSPNAASPGNLADGQTAMDSMGHDPNPNIVCKLASTGNWAIVEDNIGESQSLMSAIESYQADADNFIAIEAGETPSSDLADWLDGRQPTPEGKFSGFSFFKNAGANWASANYGNIFQWYGDSDSTVAQTSTYPGLGFYKGTTAQGKVRMSTAAALEITGDTYMSSSTWYFISWRAYATDTYVIQTVAVGDHWSNAQIVSGSCSGTKDGLTLGMAMYGSGPKDFDGWRWGPMGVFVDDIGEAAMKAIFETTSGHG